MKKSKLVKKALKTPEAYSPGELGYFKMWLRERKARKQRKKSLRILELERILLLS